jgi:type IV secretory pathway TraG/TraD family ATPase VirD4
MVTGASGSGKSLSVIIPIVKQLLALHAEDQENKAGALIIDPKNELLGILRKALRQCGREADLVCIGIGAEDSTWNPLADQKLSSTQIINMILSASLVMGQESRMGRSGDRFWEQADRSLLRALVTLARQPNAQFLNQEPLTFGKLQALRVSLSQSDKEILAWAKGLVECIGLDEALPLIEFATLPTNTRSCIVASCGSLLDPFCRAPLSHVLQPNSKRPEADLQSIFEEGKVIIVNTAHAENALELLPAQVLLAAEWARLVLARPRRQGNQVRPVWTVIDEAARVITPYGDPASDIMDMARANRVGVILALQNLAALHAMGNPNAVHRLAALAANHFYLANTDPVTAAAAAASLGSRRVYRLHRTVADILPPPLLFPRDKTPEPPATGVLVPSWEPTLPPEKLAQLKRGEIFYRVASTGEIGSVQADPPCPEKPATI